jgi:hypothetical protein
LHVFHDRGGDHDDILCERRQLFDHQVDHLPERAL